MIKSITQAAIFTAVLAFATVGNGQEFTLMVGTQASEASISGDTLEIVASGRLHSYTRAASLDSEDGKFAGFYNESLRKGLRFPFSGEGKMQTMDAYGNWQWTRMTVHSGKVAPAMPVAPARSYRGGSGTPRIDSMIGLVEKLTQEKRQPKHHPKPPQRQKNTFEGTWKTSNGKVTAILKFDARNFTMTRFDDWNDQIGEPLHGKYALAWKQVRGRIKVLKIDAGSGEDEVSFTFKNNNTELELFDATWTRQ